MKTFKLWSTPISFFHLGNSFACDFRNVFYGTPLRPSEFKRNMLEEIPEFAAAAKTFSGAVREYLNEQGCERGFRFVKSGSSSLEPGGFLPAHDHPTAHLSGVFYFDFQRHSPICFVDPRSGLRLKDSELAKMPDDLKMPTPANYNWGNALVHEPKFGELVIFPSYLQHYVMTNDTAQVRRSFFFDVFVQ